jgi:hypothetical protein
MPYNSSFASNYKDLKMDSGIYKLSFGYDNMVYIGQSLNIPKRFNEHITDMERGKAAENMQRAYELYGHPTMEILQVAHPDYLDRLESLFIHNYIDSGNYVVLNKTIPPVQARNDQDALTKGVMKHMKNSIPSVLRENEKLQERVEELEKALRKYHNTRQFIPDDVMYEHSKQIRKLEDKYGALVSRGFWARVFNVVDK